MKVSEDNSDRNAHGDTRKRDRCGQQAVAQLLKYRSRNEDCRGRTKRLRVSAIQRLKKNPAFTLLGLSLHSSDHG